jgi:hypothetical protein
VVQLSSSVADLHHSGRRNAIEVASIAFVALAMAAYIAGYAFSASHTDTADELLRAYQIRHGSRFPTEGPPLGQVLHLGPVWYYIVSIPLFLHDSWLSAALFVGIVCSLKFPLAYYCGSALVDRRFGVLWASALLLPGWATLEELVFLNPNAVCTAVLGILAISIALARRVTYGRLSTAGLLLGLAAHIHPTAAPAAFFLVPGLARTRRAGKSILIAFVALLAPIVALILPYLVSQGGRGFPDWAASNHYVAAEVTLRGALNAPQIAWAFLSRGGALVMQRVVGLGADTSHLVSVAAAIVFLVLVGSASSSRTNMRAFWAATGTAFIFTCWVGMMRTTTPFQFTWVLEPWYGALVALGLYRVLPPMSRVAVSVAALSALVLNIVVLWFLAHVVVAGEGVLDSRVMDIKQRSPAQVYRDTWFPAVGHAALGRMLCRAPTAASLHGPLAYIADKDLGLDSLFTCNSRRPLWMAKSSAALHIVGMSREFWKSAHSSPECWAGSLGLSTKTRTLVDQPGLLLTDGATYLPRKPSGRRTETRTFSFDTNAGDLVLITDVLDGYEIFALASATVDGKMARPLASNDESVLLPTPQSAGRHSWSITIAATNWSSIDVVGIPIVVQQAGSSAGEKLCSH